MIAYSAVVEFASLWDHAAHSLKELPRSGLLLATLLAMVLGVFGTLALRRNIAFGGIMRAVSTVGLMGILVLVVLQLSRMDTRFELALPQLGLPEQIVEGGETRVELAPDGHFWLQAEINGYPASFMVDTGATLTAISTETAEAAGLKPRVGGLPVRMQTANGTVSADLTTIDEMRFGNVSARGLDAIIAPGLGPTNVVGMNLLSRLASWRVEGGTMILVPQIAEASSAELSAD